VSHFYILTNPNLKVILKPHRELKVDNKYFERCARRGDGTEVESKEALISQGVKGLASWLGIKGLQINVSYLLS
jgi:hypothetical protein